MPTVNVDNVFTDFLFTTEELRAARILSDLQLCYFRHLRSQYMQQKIGMLVPEDPTNDRSYFLQKAEIEGKIQVMNEIIDLHHAALLEIPKPQDDPAAAGQNELSIAKNAANLVHQT